MGNIFFSKKDLKYCGENVIIGKTVRIRRPHLVSIGDNVIIDDFTYIPCSLDIGDYTHIGASTCFIGGAGMVRIGSFVNIAPSCQIVTATNDYYSGGLVGPTIPPEFGDDPIVSPVSVSSFVLLGCQTVVLPGTTLPEGLSTGAMTLLRNADYSPWTLYVGNPCRPLGQRDGTVMKRQAKRLMETRGKEWCL